jgi:membrane-associated protease RseP (regulator of RpoE activity)
MRLEHSRRRTIHLACALAALLPAGAWAGEEPKVRVVVEPKVKVVTSPGVERRVIVRPGSEPKVWEWREGDEQTMLGRGFIGVVLTELTPDLRTHFGVGDNGVLVGRVEPDSPAAKAGLKVGDILTAVDGEGVDSSMAVSRLVRPKKEGEVVALEISRDGRVQNLTATVAERDRRSFDMGPMFLKGLPGDGVHPELAYKIEREMGPALERLGTLLDDPEVKDRLIRLRSRNEELEKRLQDLEARLKDLEKRLKDGQR